jgi:hypothetical protein
MRRGSECGHMRGSKRELGCRGQEFRRRARVRARWSTAGAGRAKLTGEAHDVERERGRAHRAMARRLANRACEAEREEGSAGEETSADSLAPLGSEREGEESAGQSGADRRGTPVRGGRRALLGPGGLVWAEMAFSISMEFLIAFPFLFL